MLAEKLQTTNRAVCDWEKGRSQPDLKMLAEIATFFDVSCDYLLGIEIKKPSRKRGLFV